MKEEWVSAIKENKFVVVLLVVCVVLFVLSKLVNYSSNNKLDEQKEYVYTKDSYAFQGGENTSTLPVINLKGQDAETLNQTLEKLYEDKDNILLSYYFDITDGLLSFAYCKTSFLEDKTPIFEMKTAIFSIKDHRMLSEDEILKRFSISKEEAWKKVHTQMESYYDTLVEKGDFESAECDFSCFLEWKKWTDKEPLALYIEEGKLSHLQSWTVYLNEEMENFSDDFTKFTIVEEEA